MARLLLTTKLYVLPPRPHLVLRPSLLQRLDEGLHPDHRVTLISAPAGFGKTTLLSQWAHQPQRSVGWLSLDEGDNEPAGFFAYFVATLEHTAPEIYKNLLPLLQDRQPPPPETLLATLINQLAAIPNPFSFVLDDYHTIRNPTIHDALAFLIEKMPPQIHLIISTRADPPLPLARLRASGQLIELRAADLRFNSDNVAAFLDQSMDLGLSIDDITALEARTEGWIAGLQLAALSLQGRADKHDFVTAFAGDDRYIAEYLFEEVFQRQPPDVQTFLRQTCILERLCAPLCDAMAGRSDGQAMLDYLEQANLFITPLDNQQQWYRYHQLFADSLRIQNKPHQLSSLHLKATRWLEDNGLLAEAVKHAIATGDVAEAGRTIWLATVYHLLNHGEVYTMIGWSDALPDDFVRANYRLAIQKGWVLFLTGQVEAAEACAELAQKNLPPNATPTSRSRLLGLRAYLALVHNDINRSIELSKEALSTISTADPTLRSVILVNLAFLQWMVGDIAAATKNCRDAVQLGQAGGKNLAAMWAQATLAQLLHVQGRRREAAALCRQAIEQYVDEIGKPLPIAGSAHVVLGIMYYEANELVKARQHLLRGLEFCQQLAVEYVTVIGKITLAKLQQATGEEEAALVTIQEARQAASRLDILRTVARAAAAEASLHLKQGNIAAAKSWADEANLSPADIPEPLREPEYFVYVRLLLAQNRPQDALNLLTNLARSAEEGARYGSLIAIQILQSLAQQALGHEDEALHHLEQAMRLAEPEGYVRIFVDEGTPMNRLLYKATERGIAPDYAGKLLAAFPEAELAPVGQPRRQILKPKMLEPLSMREIEVLQCIAEGLSNDEIAQRLSISLSTVKSHTLKIYGKLDVNSRTQAVAKAGALGILASP